MGNFSPREATPRAPEAIVSYRKEQPNPLACPVRPSPLVALTGSGTL